MGEPLQEPPKISGLGAGSDAEPIDYLKGQSKEARAYGYGERLKRAAVALAALGVSSPEELSAEQLKDAIWGGKITFDALDYEELEYVKTATLNEVPLEEQTVTLKKIKETYNG